MNEISRRDMLKLLGMSLVSVLSCCAKKPNIDPGSETQLNIEWVPTFGDFLPQAFELAENPKQKASVDRSKILNGVVSYSFLDSAEISENEEGSLTLNIKIPSSNSLVLQSYGGGMLSTFKDLKGKIISGTVDPRFLTSARNFAGRKSVNILLTNIILLSTTGVANQFIVPGIVNKNDYFIEKESHPAPVGLKIPGQDYYIRINENGKVLYYTGQAFERRRSSNS